jgi:S1-C subfamily serine protease
MLAARGAPAQMPLVMKAEADRVAVIAKVKPTVVAIFARGGQGGGTGVLIDPEGYALTNFHVVQPTGPTMQCGLADGVLYDGVVVGIDKVGDVALIKLLPKKPGQKFPYALMGDSDKVREGDWSLAMGNPFLLATDFTPTVTFGLVSGVHRYQPPSGGFLEYTDCIQIDTSINPGNSGGPLFNLQGDVIGINGRGSFDKRARINSGVGYAISINQIKNFMGHLRAGLDVDHASLGALVKMQAEKNGIGRSTITSIIEEADAWRRGLEPEDELVSFAGRLISSDNHYKNILGILPRGWRVPLEYRRDSKKKEILVRLMGQQRKEIEDGVPLKVDPKQPKINPKGTPGAQGAGAKFYEAKAGFTNYYFNRQEKSLLFKGLNNLGDFASATGAWTVEGDVLLLKARSDSKFEVEIKDQKVGESEKPLVTMKLGKFPYELEPLDSKLSPRDLRNPKESGGILAAMYLWRHLLMQGDKAFRECDAGGTEPLYPPLPDGAAPKNWADTRVMASTLLTRLGVYRVKWFFSQNDQKLIGMEMSVADYEDPCEVFFGDYRNVNGRQLPHRIQVYHSDVHYGTFTVTSYKLAGK